MEIKNAMTVSSMSSKEYGQSVLFITFLFVFLWWSSSVHHSKRVGTVLGFQVGLMGLSFVLHACSQTG